MARDLNGSSEYITFPLQTGQHSLDQITIAHWINPDSNAQYARTFDRYNSSTDDRTRWEFDDGWGWVFCAGWSSSEGKWSIAKPSTGVWTHGCVTYDWSSTGHRPVMYRNGTSESITNRATPSGTKENTGATLRLGANPTPGDYYNGKIAEFAMWNRVLTPSEVAVLASGYSPLFIRNGLVFYAPLIGRNSPESDLIKGASGTLTGSANFAHPPIIYPSNVWVGDNTVSVPPASDPSNNLFLLGVS